MFDNLTASGAPPSLNALRAFEAMARTGSATVAAAELNVTHSAVSRQVKALEAQLGVRLFEGPRHALILTRSGRDLLPSLTSAFDEIAAAVLRARGAGQDLHVAINASLAVKWLIPRLAEFAGRHPEVRVHLLELSPHATSRRGADLILRLLNADQVEDLGATPLIANAVGPVMAPSVTNSEQSQDALLAAPRLVARTHLPAWRLWAELDGRPLPKAAERPVAHLHFALDAALSGWGAAVLPWMLAAEAVKTGRLVAPFGFQRDGGAFAAIAGSGDPSRAQRIFTQWLVDQGRQMPSPSTAT